MDLETENRLAALLVEEARRLRQEADKEGVGIYLCNPKVRGRPNSRFLTATVLGVQQANRAVEVNEMWRARDKELELDKNLSYRSKGTENYRGKRYNDHLSKESTSSNHGRHYMVAPQSKSSGKHKNGDLESEDSDDLKDEEVEEFLKSRVKRGRGAVGSRMDEPGPYPFCSSLDKDGHLFAHESCAGDEGKRLVLGPEKPSCLVADQHKNSSGRYLADKDRGSRPKRTQSDNKHSHWKSKEKRRKHKSRHPHKH